VRKLKRLGDIVSNRDRERLAEVRFAAEADQIQLQRLRLKAQRLRPVLDRRDVEIRLSGNGTDGRKLVARHLNLRDAGIRECLQARVVLGAGMAERDELARARTLFHSPYCRHVSDAGGSGRRPVRRVYIAGPPYAEEYRRRATALARGIGWEAVDPMRRDFRGETAGHEAEIVEGDLAEIESCDAVLAAFTAADEGTAMEAWYAHSIGKRLIAYTGGTPPHPWTVYVADAIHDELDPAVRALADEDGGDE
jgi:nucleoside 2-deoxyribosyltransferase